MRRERGALIFAAATHGALLLALESILPAPRPVRRAMRESNEKSLEIDLDPGASVEPSPLAQLASSALSLREPARSQARPDLAGPMAKPCARHSAAESTPEPLLEEPPAQALSGPVDSTNTAVPPGFRAPPSTFDVLGGAVGANPFLATLAAGSREGVGGNAHGPNEAERTLRAELRERDRDLGLGASGPVVVAVEEIARTSTASVESHAVVDVVANGEGEIISVTVSSASEDRSGWDEVAKKLLASFQARAKRMRVRVPHGSRGLVMTIAIDSREALPSGAAPGANVELFGQKVASGKNARSNGVTVFPLAKIPLTLPVPGMPGATRTTTLVLPVPVPSISGTFDLSDIGAAAARVVHARATSEREL